jgi:hypothetical protein
LKDFSRLSRSIKEARKRSQSCHITLSSPGNHLRPKRDLKELYRSYESTLGKTTPNMEGYNCNKSIILGTEFKWQSI